MISKIGRTAHDKASEHWRELARKWNAHIAKIRKNLKSDEHDATEMENYAEMSEGYAFDAIVFAQASIYEAEYAALDALATRRRRGDGILRGCHILGDARTDYSGRPGSGEARVLVQRSETRTKLLSSIGIRACIMRDRC